MISILHHREIIFFALLMTLVCFCCFCFMCSVVNTELHFEVHEVLFGAWLNALLKLQVSEGKQWDKIVTWFCVVIRLGWEILPWKSLSMLIRWKWYIDNFYNRFFYAWACCVIMTTTVAERTIQFMAQKNIGRFVACVTCSVIGVRRWSAGDVLSCQVPHGRPRSKHTVVSFQLTFIVWQLPCVVIYYIIINI